VAHGLCRRQWRVAGRSCVDREILFPDRRMTIFTDPIEIVLRQNRPLCLARAQGRRIAEGSGLLTTL